MKFHVLAPQIRAPRLGIISAVERSPNFEIPTPAVFLHTQGGHVPHITHEVFKLVSKEPQVLQVPLVGVHNIKEVMDVYQGVLSEFIGSKDNLIYLNIHDPSLVTPQGHHMKDMIPVWTRRGKVLYGAKEYMRAVESFKPDMYCLLSDSDTNLNCPQKRVTKAVDLTIELNKHCLDLHRKSPSLKDKFVIAPIAGGYCLKSRERCLKAVTENDECVSGVLIDGLHNNGPEVEFLPYMEVEAVVKLIIEKLSHDKIVLVQGCWNPIDVIKLVEQGVDVFDTSYCQLLTERSTAMTYGIDDGEITENFVINLRELKYVDDFLPVMSTCNCPTCSKFSRAYIHHLLMVQELLGPVLIMIHNMYHFLRFFKQIRKKIADGMLTEFGNQLSEHFVRYKTYMKNN